MTTRNRREHKDTEERMVKNMVNTSESDERFDEIEQPQPPIEFAQRVAESGAKTKRTPIFLVAVLLAMSLILLGLVVIFQPGWPVVGGGVVTVAFLVAVADLIRGWLTGSETDLVSFRRLGDRLRWLKSSEQRRRTLQRALAVGFSLTVLLWGLGWAMSRVIQSLHLPMSLRAERMLVVVLDIAALIVLVLVARGLYDHIPLLRDLVAAIGGWPWLRAFLAVLVLVLSLWLYYTDQFVTFIGRVPLGLEWDQIVEATKSYKPSNIPLVTAGLLLLLTIGTHLLPLTEARRRRQEAVVTHLVYILTSISLVAMLASIFGWRALVPAILLLIIAAAMLVTRGVEDVRRLSSSAFDRVSQTVEAIIELSQVVWLGIQTGFLALVWATRVVLQRPYEFMRGILRAINSILRDLLQYAIDTFRAWNDRLMQTIDRLYAKINEEYESEEAATEGYASRHDWEGQPEGYDASIERVGGGRELFLDEDST